MGSTNKTTYYELSQFIGTDKPAWLQDYNGDMLKIDTGINAAKVAADDAASAASGAQSDATDALTAIRDINTALETINTTLGSAVGSINTINSLIGNGTPTTSDQTIIGAVNGLEGSIAPREDGAALANNYAIGEQFARGGSVYTALVALTADTPFASLTLNTDYKVSDTLVGQIADVINNLPDLNNIMVIENENAYVSITADGIKTLDTLLAELYSAFMAMLSELETNEHVTPNNLTIPTVGTFTTNALSYPVYKTTPNWYATFKEVSVGVNNFTVGTASMGPNAGNRFAVTALVDGTPSVAFTNHNSDVLTNGTEINISYVKYKVINS